MYWAVPCLLVLFLSSPLHAAETEQPPCDDPAVWTDWQEKASKHAGDLEFQTLHALWIGLCTKVKTGNLTDDEADELFERARARLLQRQREQQGAQGKPSL